MKKTEEVIIPIRGTLDVVLDDGRKKKKFRLSRPDQRVVFSDVDLAGVGQFLF